MNSFGRALKFAIRKRYTFVAAVISALCVALLWGGNITAVYPLVEVVLRGDSIPQWVDDRVEYGEHVQRTYQRQAQRFKRLAALQEPAERRQAIRSALAEIETLSIDRRDRAEVFEAAREERQLRRLLSLHSSDEWNSVVRKHLVEARHRADAEAEELQRVRSIRPYLHAWMPSTPMATLVLLLGLLLLGTLIKDLLLVANNLLSARLAQSAVFTIRGEFFRRTLEMDLVTTHAENQSDLMNRFTSDLNTVAAGIQNQFGRVVREPLKVIVCLIGAALCCWRLLLITLILAPAAGLAIRWLSRSLKRTNRRAMEQMSHIYEALAEVLGGLRVVKAFTMEAHERDRFAETAQTYYRKAMKIARYNALIRPMNELMGASMICVAVLVSGYLSLNHETHLFGIKISDRRLSTGACLLFYALLAGMIDPARKLSEVFGQLQRAMAASERVFELFDRRPATKDPARPRPLPRHSRSLELDKVHFGYIPHQPVLEEVCLKIPFGETWVVVGPNGSGKSTLVGLLLRFFDPDQGSVRIDGVDLREVRQRDVRRQVGLVSQETMLFDDTVLENIRYGCLDASDEQVTRAARQAHAHEFIQRSLPSGYQTRVGPTGNRLSGGQRQRIALARAMLRDPAIFILDEATSQIDPESEQLIYAALRAMPGSRTTIIVTHRSAGLALADRVVVMDRGRVQAMGTHEELLARSRFYRQFCRTAWKQSA